MATLLLCKDENKIKKLMKSKKKLVLEIFDILKPSEIYHCNQIEEYLEKAINY